jgi:hypothetical protein
VHSALFALKPQDAAFGAAVFIDHSAAEKALDSFTHYWAKQFAGTNHDLAPKRTAIFPGMGAGIDEGADHAGITVSVLRSKGLQVSEEPETRGLTNFKRTESATSEQHIPDSLC